MIHLLIRLNGGEDESEDVWICCSLINKWNSFTKKTESLTKVHLLKLTKTHHLCQTCLNWFCSHSFIHEQAAGRVLDERREQILIRGGADRSSETRRPEFEVRLPRDLTSTEGEPALASPPRRFQTRHVVKRARALEKLESGSELRIYFSVEWIQHVWKRVQC